MSGNNKTVSAQGEAAFTAQLKHTLDTLDFSFLFFYGKAILTCVYIDIYIYRLCYINYVPT